MQNVFFIMINYVNVENADYLYSKNHYNLKVALPSSQNWSSLTY